MKVLSIRQPWAWLIVQGIKTVENRSWPTKFRGQFLVHASGKMDMAPDEFNYFRREMKKSGVIIPEKLLLGGIVGMANLVDCVTKCADDYDDSWHEPGMWAFILRDAKETPFLPVKGALNFWEFEYKENES